MSVRTICNLAEDIPFRRIGEGDAMIAALNEAVESNQFNRNMTGTEVLQTYFKLDWRLQQECNRRLEPFVQSLQSIINEIFRIREQDEQTPASVHETRLSTGLIMTAFIMVLMAIVISWHFVNHLTNRTELPTGLVWQLYSSVIQFIETRPTPDDL